VGLDQLAAVEHLDQRAVGADLDLLADQLPGQRIQGLADLDVMVAVHLGRHVVRDVVAVGRRREQHGVSSVT